MTGTAPTPVPLTDRFRELYSRLAEVRRRLAAASAAAAAAPAGRGAGPPAPSLEAAQRPLLEYLEEMESAALDPGSADALELEEARYLMAAFADDLFTRSGAPLSVEWKAASLESQLFHSEAGGRAVFERIDKLLEVGDPGRRELAKIYLMALSLGFRGADRVLGGYRRRLVAFALPEREAGSDPARLTPSAYRHTIARGRPALLPAVRRWGLAALATLLLVAAISYPLWREATAPIAAVVERIERLVDRSAPR